MSSGDVWTGIADIDFELGTYGTLDCPTDVQTNIHIDFVVAAKTL